MLRGWETRNAKKPLVEIPEGKIPLGIPRSRRKDNIKTDLVAIGWDYMHWIHQTQYRVQWRFLVNMIMTFRVLQKAGNLSTSWVTVALRSSNKSALYSEGFGSNIFWRTGYPYGRFPLYLWVSLDGCMDSRFKEVAMASYMICHFYSWFASQLIPPSRTFPTDT
jgi:hypothetical protein